MEGKCFYKWGSWAPTYVTLTDCTAVGENWTLAGCPSQAPLDSASGERLTHPSSLGLSNSRGHKGVCSHFLRNCSLPSWLWGTVIREAARGTGDLVLWVSTPCPHRCSWGLSCLHSLARPYSCPWLLPVPLYFFLSSVSFLKVFIFNFPLLCECVLFTWFKNILSTFI